MNLYDRFNLRFWQASSFGTILNGGQYKLNINERVPNDQFQLVISIN